MNQKKVLFIVCTAVTVISLFFGIVSGLPDNRTHITFCNVGQGDAMYIRTSVGQDIVIDGGPNERVLSCLGERMAFWDREIDLMVLTHPHEDHFKGLIEILKRYRVKNIVIPPIENSESDLYTSFITLVKNEQATVKNLYQGEKIEFTGQKDKNSSINKIVFNSLWPAKKWVADNSSIVLNGTNFASETAYSDLNDFSQILQMSYGDFDVLFTGDGESSILEQLKNLIPPNSIEVLKVPHQGNKNALTEDLVSYIKPKLGVIMVGKNSYGHPSPQTIQLLTNNGSLVRRTDQDGDVEIVSDGQNWWIID